MKDTTATPLRLAVLIDADNAQPAVVEELIAEIARFGTASVKRIYGDWTSPQHGQWKKSLLRHSLHPVQQFAYTSGKNATDSALIIDAMDLLYTRRFDGFCLVSSDSDFTRLAQRIREEGLKVFGFGEKKTPEAFVAACDKFIYTELLRATPVEKPAARAPAKGKQPQKPGAGKASDAAAAAATDAADRAGSGRSPASAPPLDAVALLSRAIEEAETEDGWAHLGTVGSYLNAIRPDFDPRLFGVKKLSDLVRANPKRFELREQPLPGGESKTLFVRAIAR